MESSIVIKVKYEDTLRRFKAHIVNEELDLNMDLLREKIVSLFNFAPDTQLHFTYNDEDGDVVALVDDEDLLDVARQALNPLRITVRSSTVKSLNSSSSHSSGSSTPTMSSPLQEKLHNLNSSVSKILRSLRKLNREPLSKLSSDLAEIASTYGASNIAEITDTLSKLGLRLSHLSEFPSTRESKKSVEACKDSDGLKNPVPTEVTSGASCGKPTSSKIKIVLRKSKSSSKNDGVNLQGVSEAPPGLKSSLAASVSGSTNASPPAHPIVPNAHVAIKDKEVLKETGEVDGVKYFNAQPVENNGSSSGIDNSLRYGNRTTSVEGRRKKKSVSGLQSSSAPLVSFTSLNECPFTGKPVINYSASPHDTPSEMPERIYNCSHGIFHRAIRCDGCGVHPVTGPRFKSIVKEDYDLCSICFAKMGNDADFMRIDHPVVYHRHSSSSKVSYSHTLPQKSKCHRADATPLELDSSVILDVNIILNGTAIPPLAQFQRTWRMKNNGKTVWPQGTRLVWIGGVKMTNSPSIELETDAAGVQVDQELDVSVDFVAPERHGRYISYMRMALPNGQKFGQRIWVLINVDASLKKPIHSARPGFNLNLPLASVTVTAPEVDAPIPEPTVDQSLPEPNMSNASVETVVAPIPEPMVDQSLPEPNISNASVGTVDAPIREPTVDQILPEPNMSNASVETIQPIVNGKASKDQEAKFPIDETLLVGSASLESDEANVDAQTKEEMLLEDLKEMGFNHTSLNKKILKMNKYDLQQTIIDLCGDSEWDTILEELEEMGFSDKDINKRLLRKNDGSSKRVVMDLIAGE